MKFKIRLLTKLMYVCIPAVFIWVIYLTKVIPSVLGISQLAEIMILIGLFLLSCIYIFIYDETYMIEDGTIRIKRGLSTRELKISDIDYVYYKTFDNTNRIISINMNEAHLVVGEEKISINTDARNNVNKSLIDVLTKRYNKRIMYDNSLRR